MSQIPQLMNGNRLEHDAVSEKGWYSRSPGGDVQIFDDFIGDGALPLDGATLGSGSLFVNHDNSAAGAPTLAYRAGANGVYRMELASDAEAERVATYLGDNCVVSPTKKPIFEARVAITTASPNAAETLIIGLGSARNNDTNAIANHCLFKWTGANNNILVESDDDGTTDTDDKDTGQDWVSGTFYKFKIDMSDLSDVKFYIDDVDVTPTTMNVSGMAAGDLLQPIIELQKASGNTIPRVDIDYISVVWERS